MTLKHFISSLSIFLSCSILPAPVHKVYDKDEDKGKRIQLQSQALMLASATIPPYGHRKGWVPRNQDDFGDGGAFPEIPIAQFPLGSDLPLLCF